MFYNILCHFMYRPSLIILNFSRLTGVILNARVGVLPTFSLMRINDFIIIIIIKLGLQ